jgi:hypothetical protein
MVTQPNMDPQGKTHKVVVIAPTRHVWVKTAQGWRLKSGETMQGGAMTVDGKPASVN